MSPIASETEARDQAARRAARDGLFTRAQRLVGLEPAELDAAGEALDLLGDVARLRYVEQLAGRSRSINAMVWHGTERNRRSLTHRLDTLCSGGVVERRGREYAVRGESLKLVARYVDLLLTLSSLNRAEVSGPSAGEPVR